MEKKRVIEYSFYLVLGVIIQFVLFISMSPTFSLLNLAIVVVSFCDWAFMSYIAFNFLKDLFHSKSEE